MPKLKYNEPCYYCGTDTDKLRKVKVFGEQHELPVCSDACADDLVKYAEWDNKNRLPAYLILLVGVVFNMLVLGFGWKFWWGHLSLTLIGITLYFYPLILFRYSSYLKYGVKKTLNVIRVAGILIAIIGVVLAVLNRLSLG